MKILSWNVNGLRSVARKNEIQKIINSQIYDVILLQETKIEEINKLIETNGYVYYIMHSTVKKGYSGVITFCKETPINVIYGIGHEKYDNEGRVITIELKDYFIVNSYFPNSRRDLSRLDFKKDFNEKILEFLEKLRKRKPVVIGGDFNVAHTDLDIARPKQNDGNAGFTREERAFVDKFIEKGYIDTFRLFNKEGGNYSWWTYLYKSAKANNIAWRIDYFLVSSELKNKVKAAGIIKKQEGSDHAPVFVEVD
ncbi:MAG: exodeoxyribonuclease III [Candidatus Parvarchaeum acidiphilum ARMAN-4]|uniref:Exodeoxyribonuclease III n=1 Tax=Candidatus Parvarchaeum acidiphilum ARMAN-4 TaxID=662760 RepID=D2EEB5_PARA4|nr:MAG: exodeoxyribonuclease III [Candidatus Parvarchaeum acidiphilum ARMAN-4]